MQSLAPDRVEVWEPAATGHTRALTTHLQEWASRVRGFLDRRLAV